MPHKKDNPTIIIQARMGSTRLPSKCIMTVYKNETMLDHMLNRLKKGCVNSFNILVGTPPDMISQKPIHDICRRHDVTVFIGSEDDLLSRYYYGAKKYNADPIIRITSDCPLLDPALIDEAYVHFNAFNIEYFTNSPRVNHNMNGYPSGFDVEVIAFKLLEQLYQEVKEPELREHCTKALTVLKYKNITRASIMEVALFEPFRFNTKFSVDTKQDLAFVRRIISSLYPLKELYTYKEVLNCASMKGFTNENKRKKK